MAENRGYVLSDVRERREEYTKLLAKLLFEYYQRVCGEILELFDRQRESYEDSFCRTFQRAEDFLETAIASQKKGKLKYIHFSYLLSGALSGEHLVKMDFYDAGYYKDVEESDCFWDCSGLFPSYEKECKSAEADLKKKIVRVQSGEISRLRVGLTACDYLALKPVLAKLVGSARFSERLSPYCERPAFILYGGYLSEAELLRQF